MQVQSNFWINRNQCLKNSCGTWVHYKSFEDGLQLRKLTMSHNAHNTSWIAQVLSSDEEKLFFSQSLCVKFTTLSDVRVFLNCSAPIDAELKLSLLFALECRLKHKWLCSEFQIMHVEVWDGVTEYTSTWSLLYRSMVMLAVFE